MPWFAVDGPSKDNSITNAIGDDSLPVSATIWVSPKRAARMFDISEATLYRWLKTRSDFPKPVKLSPGCTRFDLNKLNAFAASKGASK